MKPLKTSTVASQPTSAPSKTRRSHFGLWEALVGRQPMGAPNLPYRVPPQGFGSTVFSVLNHCVATFSEPCALGCTYCRVSAAPRMSMLTTMMRD